MFTPSNLFLVAVAGFAAVRAHIEDISKRQESSSSIQTSKTRNFIMVIPDGFGPASEVMARDWVHSQNATDFLPIDQMVIGQIRTKAINDYVTDSAASATAYSCGIKSYNGAIAVDPSRLPCGTVLEAAKLKGYKTGLVATSRITHATPACYASHVVDRNMEESIAAQLVGYAHPLGQTVDIILGGGRCYFLPKGSSGACRKDSVDLESYAREKGFTVFSNRTAFDSPLKLPYLGLFDSDHMAYEVERNPALQPSLTEMAIKAVEDLYNASKDNENGFFIMVEASRIDHAGHSNDAVAHLGDIIEYNNVMKALREWIDAHHNSPTTLISTADHETGGLTVGASDHSYDPRHFAGAGATAATLASKWKSYTGASDAQQSFVQEEIFAKYGVSKPTADEVAQAISLKTNSGSFESFLKAALDNRLHIDWTTGGHTGVDVTLYGWGENHKEFVGNHENNEVGAFITRLLGLDLDGVTRTLNAQTEWIRKTVQGGGSSVRRRSPQDYHHHHD